MKSPTTSRSNACGVVQRLTLAIWRFEREVQNQAGIGGDDDRWRQSQCQRPPAIRCIASNMFSENTTFNELPAELALRN
jgi:hypothetical protein